jgi:hypothetical protein
MTSLEILYIAESADRQPGIANLIVVTYMCGVQTDGIHNGIQVMLGSVIGAIGIGAKKIKREID